MLGLFSGIGFLDRCFEDEGFCVVRGPDLLWGHDMRGWRPPADVFDGIIAGVPCQRWSPLAHMVRHTHGEDAVAPDMFPELERCVTEARPGWFLTECSPFAPIPRVDGYTVTSLILDNRWIGEGVGQIQSRRRRFCFSTRQAGAAILDCGPDLAVFESADRERAVIATGSKEGSIVKLDKGGAERPYEKRRTLPGQQPRRSVARCLELQGWPPDFLDDAPFTQEAKYRLVGNGVPRPMGLAIARAVKRALGYTRIESLA